MRPRFFDSIKRAAAVASAVCIAAVYGIGAAAEENGEPDFIVNVSAPPHIVFLGDSITAGYGLDGYTPDDLSVCPSYANILTKEFDSELPAQAGFTAENYAKSGTTSIQMLEKLRSGELDEALDRADAVVMSIGGNDLLDTFLAIMEPDIGFGDTIGRILSLSEDLDEKLNGFAVNMPQIADELVKRCGKTPIFVQTLYNPMEDTFISAVNEMSAEKIGELNRIITACSKDGSMYTIADVAAGFEGRANELTNIGSFDIHPNAAGHAEIARIVYPVVESAGYSYRDNEAAMQYELDMALIKLEREEKRIERTRLIAVCSGAAAFITGAGAAIVTALIRKKSPERKIS